MVAIGEVTRGEFDMLRDQVGANAHRLDTMDQGGTRGVGIVQVQLTDLAKDVATLSQRLDQHDREHEKDAEDRRVKHEQDAKDRRASKRWAVGTAIAFLAMVEGPLLYLISQGHH